MEPLFREKGLTLSIERPDAEITVSTEPEKLEKALRNILANALQYTSAGGVSISYGKEDQRFYIEVKDTGSGISREELARVFNRFHKGEDSKGFGLGLAITRELIEIMGGSVRAASTPGRGAAFRIDLPL
jgi:signal transduction histidine kinase